MLRYANTRERTVPVMSLPDFKYKQIIIHVVRKKGEKLRFRADNIVIKDAEGKTVLQHSCHRTFALFVVGDISVTSVMIRHCVKYHFPIILMNRSLKIITKFNCEAEGNTLLRRRQYGASPAHNLDVAKSIIRQKIGNQRKLLLKIRQKSKEDLKTADYLSSINIDKARNTYELMGMEGLASRAFFRAYFRQLGWNRREPRCKRDIANLLLDIGYTWLFQFMESLLSLYGFDLYCGVLHTFFYQRKSLVCDIVEPFRCIIDARIKKAYNLGQIDEKDFELKDGRYFLNFNKQEKYIALFLKDILSYKEEMFKFCRSYYRWVARSGRFEEFPVFSIG